ncbi:iron-sulfur cluster repair protein YtfE [Laribacter hongkongensis]|uniref:Iron-sulfur cluster repair di-iron protein n=1 Tax=Laribacter hongkongensis TaxID=168471 RepID=A0A248LIQ1_9NEIS|nr:iron-sulfur cluster repair protein YtfE [Laribacter hongkongensis]ASJ24379.1 iron-sulfur cluster repair di-iron protein [Laribacter hongkongensis]MCG9042020.1 iron-sulfur cluster repair protein YtfE [Laribacter hongkongensis]MCG9069056.1 iron-sulfur cluster repair protein YtfE [Laribacter hongkongensis]MCG9087863.1 iron-sulfur cluster repair protein YtfE [Laribacter hongkongensis]MCG9110724.1 iron-sulfur cluster repair protein YtfE [Laribacter hongkongensis]
MTRSQTATAIDPTQAIGQIAVALPGATAIFRRLKLDYCCGGQISLQQVVRNKELEIDPVMAELTTLQRGETTSRFESAAELIDHILVRYHDTHRAQLPVLIALAKRVEAVHRDHPAVPAGLAALLGEIQKDLLQHMQKEEQVLFPVLKAGGNPFVIQPIGIMRSEHVEHGANLERLAALTDDMTAPPDACTTWNALYAGIRQLGEDLINHIHLENNVLFPQFEISTETPADGGPYDS